MAIVTQTSAPSTLTAGDTVRWSVAGGSYPADEWELTYYLSRPGRETIRIAASANGTDYLVSMSAEDTAQLDAGRWEWRSRAYKQDDGAISISSGSITVYPDPARAHRKTFSEEALEMVEASIRGDLPTAQESMSIAGVDITKMPLSERFRLRETIKAEIARERRASRLSSGENLTGLQVRFKC